jgi:hypothetical protein
MIMAFVDEMRAQAHAVESTCKVLTEHGCTVAARIGVLQRIRPRFHSSQ